MTRPLLLSFGTIAACAIAYACGRILARFTIWAARDAFRQAVGWRS